MKKTEKTIIRSREGLTIRDPKTNRDLPAEGLPVKLNEFWRRRIRDKDVEVVSAEEHAKAKAKKAADEEHAKAKAKKAADEKKAKKASDEKKGE